MHPHPPLKIIPRVPWRRRLYGRCEHHLTTQERLPRASWSLPLIGNVWVSFACKSNTYGNQYPEILNQRSVRDMVEYHFQNGTESSSECCEIPFVLWKYLAMPSSRDISFILFSTGSESPCDSSWLNSRSIVDGGVEALQIFFDISAASLPQFSTTPTASFSRWFLWQNTEYHASLSL
jgi:hypothetical protein